MVPELSDEDLLEAYRGGDGNAFEALFRRYQERLRRHLERVLGDRAAAEDVVIETFERVHSHRDRFRPGAALRPWIYTIARNLARNRRRRDGIVRWLGLEAVDRETSTPGGYAAPGRDGEIRHRVSRAFAALPAAQREVCSLRLVGELGLAEIVKVTGASLGTVKSRLFYGQRRLRDLLSDLAPAGAPAATVGAAAKEIEGEESR